MTYLRHASRHLARTIEDDLKAWLGGAGWLSTPALWGTTPVQVRSVRMRESELTALSDKNIVGIFTGAESDDEAIQLGGGFCRTNIQMIIDVVAVNEAIGVALAADVKDYLSGRYPGGSRFFQLRDYTNSATGTPLPDWQVEVLSAVRQRPDTSEAKAFWQLILVELELTFPGDD